MLVQKSLLAISISSLMVFNVAAQDVLISEYIEGSSNNKAIELYNPSSTAIDLSNYVLSFYFNGNTAATTNIALNGNIAANSTFVIMTLLQRSLRLLNRRVQRAFLMVMMPLYSVTIV
jgi:predicted extracellular nuclease